MFKPKIPKQFKRSQITIQQESKLEYLAFLNFFLNPKTLDPIQMKPKPKYQKCTVCKTAPWLDVMHDDGQMPCWWIASSRNMIRAVADPGDSALIWLLLQYTSPSRAHGPTRRPAPPITSCLAHSSFGKLDSGPHRPSPGLAYEGTDMTRHPWPTTHQSSNSFNIKS